MNVFRTQRILTAIATLIMLCWAPIVLPAGVLTSGFDARAQSKPASASVCHCLMCVSGKMCCCLAKVGAKRMCYLRSTCETPIAIPSSLVLPKVLPASTFRVEDTPVRVSHLLRTPAGVRALISRASTPPNRPPRLS